MAYQPLPKEDLRLGLFIKIVGNWFSHPFPKNAFKIKTEKELATLRALEKYQFQYDPARSDALPPSNQGGESFQDQAPAPDSPDSMSAEEDSHDVSPDLDLGNPQVMSEKRRDQLKEAERSYQHVLQENKASIREVKEGYAKGIGKAESLITTLGEILNQNRTLVTLMNFIGTEDEDDEFYYHSLNVCMLSMILGQSLDFPQEQISMLGMAALFHDIGELEGPTRFIPNRLTITKEEEVALRQHPETGQKILAKGYGIPPLSLEAIAQHHERLDGTGFPNNLKEESLNPLSKILMVVDAYDELCNNPQLEKSLTPHEAIATLFDKRFTEFWEAAVLALVHNLGVYPPSSIVELSDGSIGMVTSTNLLDRMKPTVMLHDPLLPREKAMIVDLYQEGNRTIKHSLRPGDIPIRVWKYLNPRGTISYFAFAPDSIPAPKNQYSEASQNVSAQV